MSDRRSRGLGRRRYIKRVTPTWANTTLINALYREAKRRTRVTGEEWQVDHIVPLCSPYVCGLHCEDNLRVIRAVENRQQSNHTWPNAWSEQPLLIPEWLLHPVQYSLNFEGPAT